MTSALGVNLNNDWYTPDFWIELVREVMEIDLDPASSLIANERVKAKNIFTVGDNGLTKDWYGKVFMNPPFSSPLLSNFLNKAISEFNSGRVKEMIILTNSGTDTKWNQINSKGLQAYTVGRISFVRPNGNGFGSTSRGQVFTYYGNNQSKFVEVFTRRNKCWIPNKEYLDI